MLRYDWRYMVSLGVLLTLGLLWPWPRALAADPQTVTQTLTYANGDVYVGETVNGKRQGEGVYTYKDGKRYTGAWQDDKRHGQGTYAMHDDQKYIGAWQDDKPQGKGTWVFPDSTQYIGEWRDEKPSRSLFMIRYCACRLCAVCEIA